MNRSNERGVALILTMILLVLVSVMAVSLAFISKTETLSSMNYRLMSQARDAAESGVNTTANYLMNTYTLPGAVSDPFTNYNMTASPVQYPAANASGHDVILSANTSGTSSNYPITTVQSAFDSNGIGKGSFSAGNTTINYKTSAKLLYMQQLAAAQPYTSTATTVQTWEITSDSTIDGIQSAAERVTAILERNVMPVFAYAAFATDPTCSALTFGGGGITNSYNSSAALVSGLPAFSATAGNVGTNGNLSTSGSPTTINGTLSTPRAGVGTCTTSNVTAWTGNQGTVTGGLVELPQTVIYPTPTIPANSSTDDLSSNSSCPVGLTGCVTSGSGGSSIMTLNPSAAGGACASASPPNCSMFLRDVTMNGNADLHLAAGIYNINSIKEMGNTRLVLDSVPVIFNVTGAGQTTVVDLTGGSVVNTTGNYDPMTFQILYAGTGNIILNGGASAVGLVYAPNSSYRFTGGGDWYGSVIGKTMTDMGGTAIHYDRRLKDKAYIPGPYMLSSFTWNKY